MNAWHHYHQYCYYLSKAYVHGRLYHQYMARAGYHLTMHQNLLENDEDTHYPSIPLPGQEESTAVISTVYIKNELIDVEYPRVSGLYNPMVENQINREIRRLIHQMIGEQIPPESQNTSITGRYKVPLNQEGLLSIRLENYAYTPPAAHGFTIVRSLTFDLNTGYIYKFSDLFDADSNYKERIDQIIKRQIDERQIPLIAEFTGVSEDQEYYLTPNALVVYFQLYKLAPYVYGIVEFDIPYQSIQDIIDPTGPIARLL